MKLACSTGFVCSNYSTIFASDDFSSFNEFGQVGETAKKLDTNFKIKMSQLIVLGQGFRKPVNANPGLKVNRGNNFSRKKVLSIPHVLRSLRLLVLKTEGQKI